MTLNTTIGIEICCFKTSKFSDFFFFLYIKTITVSFEVFKYILNSCCTKLADTCLELCYLVACRTR